MYLENRAWNETNIEKEEIYVYSGAKNGELRPHSKCMHSSSVEQSLSILISWYPVNWKIPENEYEFKLDFHIRIDIRRGVPF